MLQRCLVLTLAMALAACSDGAATTADANGDVDADSGIDASPPIPCRPLVLGVGNGHHNPGKACLSCHNGSVARARIWTAAGTVYNKSGAALAGATITLIDATGKTFDLVSQINGNFYTNLALTFPVRVSASSCPLVAAMPKAAIKGDCNAGDCHGSAMVGKIQLQ